jgi:hypothetical protein
MILASELHENPDLTLRNQSQCYLTTDGHSASLSWYQATIWEQRPTFFLSQENNLQTFGMFFIMGLRL